jgi:hypothetical protein
MAAARYTRLVQPTSSRGGTRWSVLLSHAGSGELDRCLAIPLGSARVHLCARCVGLYPALAAGLWARLAHPGWVEGRPWLALALRLVVPLAGGVAWALEQAWPSLARSGPAARVGRTASGVALGAGIGWVLGRHLQSPWPGELVELAAGLAAILVAGVLARTLRSAWSAADLPVMPGPAVDPDGKKTPLRGENEVDPESS